MSRSQDPDNFFQTSQSLAETSRKAAKSSNEYGAPIRLKSKILAVLVDPIQDGALYIAESVGQVRRLILDTGESSQIYRGPTAPLTSLALSPDNKTLFAGSWDKNVWAWPVLSRPTTGRCFKGHTDFVKTVLCARLPCTSLTAQPFDILISGSADSTIIVWNLSNGAKLHTLIGHNRGILCLAIDPLSYPDLEAEKTDGDVESITLFSGSSDREILKWTLSSNMNAPSSGARSTISPNEEPIQTHETSVYDLRFDADGDLWTASADGTAKCLSRSDNWTADTSLPHGDYVRAVALDDTRGLVITAGRDEDVKLWEKGSGKMIFAYRGHYDEITSLALLKDNIVISGGIDGTIRHWSLAAEDIGRAKQEREDEERGLEIEEVLVPKTANLATEDEDKELAELMDDDD